MNAEKQQIVLQILKTGQYEIDAVNGLIYSIRKRGKSLLKPGILPSEYCQLMLFLGRGTGVKVIVYVHELIYIAWHGAYDERLEIDHLDRIRRNNGIFNLIAKTPKQNKANSKEAVYPDELKLIRSKEISLIRSLHSQGNSQQRIAKQLGLNRLSVRYIIKRIDAGLPLKYE